MIKFHRAWAMPNAETFSIKPIKGLLLKTLKKQKSIIDPFARDSKFAHFTNDLNPKTSAQYHLHAEDFCDLMIEMKITADAIIFDPPYSPRQVQEIYQSIGKKVTMKDTQTGSLYKNVKDKLNKILIPGGIVICCGWSSCGFGINRGFDLKEILLVCHGGAHNDTIITIEEKTKDLFD